MIGICVACNTVMRCPLRRGTKFSEYRHMFCTVVPDSPFRRATDLEKAQYDLSGWQIGASLKADDLALLERVAATISCDGTNRYMAHFRATSPVTAVAGVSAGPFQSAELALAFIREETAA